MQLRIVSDWCFPSQAYIIIIYHYLGLMHTWLRSLRFCELCISGVTKIIINLRRRHCLVNERLYLRMCVCLSMFVYVCLCRAMCTVYAAACACVGVAYVCEYES